ncbi:MAG: hypothetical protein JXR48_15085 [Candidatus Delongbacteria bacterium]|nr:hypothetical protein [Candidatus Delongbacteria bacterium]MBN2836281.1 hypothetical protein [Candidatus Delongbacteria bacterium]
MKKTYYAILIIALTLLVSCGSSDSNDNKILKKESSEITSTVFPNEGLVSVKKYNIPEGADSSISAELGGDGFEKIADSLGWQTNTDFTPTGDPNAVKGGTFTLSFGEYPSTLRIKGKDANSSAIWFIGGFMYESLLNLDGQTMNYSPGLATHWKIEDDLQTFWFRIDPRARWNDGNPVTSEDVLATWKLLVDEGILSPYHNQMYGTYEEPEIISKYIVKVKSKELNWRKFMYFSGLQIFPNSHLSKIDGKGYLEKYQWKTLPGTGPYVIDENKTVKGQKIVLRKRSDYWAENDKRNIGVNNFNEIDIVVIRDEILSKEKFKKGEIDFFGVSRAQWWINEFDIENPQPPFDELTRGLVQKKKIYTFSPKGIYGLAFNTRKPPFDDVRMRQAFTMLWNFDELNNTIFFKQYSKMRSAYPGSIYENKDNIKYDYNPEKANMLLDEMGWANKDSEGYRINQAGERLELDMMIDQSNERIYTPYQSSLKNSGIKLNLKIADGNTMFQAVNERRFKIIPQSWGGLFIPNPESSMHSKYADPDNTTNITGFKSDRVDELCDEYNVCFDPKRRVEIVQEIDKIFSDSVQYAYAWYSKNSFRGMYWNKFGMPKSGLSYTGDAYDIASLWWIDPEKEAIVTKGMTDKSVTMPIEPVDLDYWNILGN